MKSRILIGIALAVAASFPPALFGQAAAGYGMHVGAIAAPTAGAAAKLGHASNTMVGRATERLSRPRENARPAYVRKVVMGRHEVAARANSMPERVAGGFEVERTAADCSAVDLKTDHAAAKSAEPACLKANAAAPTAGKPDAVTYPSAVTLSFKKQPPGR